MTTAAINIEGITNQMVVRVKVRNCIRKNTYRYKISNEFISDEWEDIKREFGPDKFAVGFDFYEIENEAFLLRTFFDSENITFIQKKKWTKKSKKSFMKLLVF